MKYLFILLSLSLSLFSCQKELSLQNSGGAVYYIQCKIDDTLHTFNYEAVAGLSVIAGTDSSVLVIHGYSESDINNLKALDLYIIFDHKTSPQSGTTYKEGTDWNDYSTFAQYNPNSETTYYSAGYISDITDDSLNIKITSKTSTEIAGTFKGAFYETDVDDNEIHAEYKSITDGKFKLKLE